MPSRPVIYTEDARDVNSRDFIWSGVGGNSIAVASLSTALDYDVPSGRVVKITGCRYQFNAPAFVPNPANVQLQLFINGQGSLAFQTMTPLVNVSTLGGRVNYILAGYMQDEFIPTYLKAESGQTITLGATISGGIVFSFIYFHLYGTIGDDTACPINQEFTNLAGTC